MRGEPVANDDCLTKRYSELCVAFAEKAPPEKAESRLKSRLKLDVGVTMSFSNGFIHQAANFMERGHDDEKDMEYVKIYYYREE